MLVKCISYIITVFGTKRYKPFLFVGVAVIATFVGVNAIISVYRPSQKPVASSVNTAEADAETYDSQGLSEQKLKQQDAAQANQSTQSDTQTQTAPAAPAATDTTTATPGIQVNQETLTVKSGATAAVTLTASLGDTSSAQWSQMLEQASGISIAANGDKNSSSYTINIKADTTATPGTHTLTISAKDGSRNLELTKVVKIVIVAE